jgi:uncharacterized protein (DUF433 family)
MQDAPSAPSAPSASSASTEAMASAAAADLEPGKRGGRPCIRGLRITVYDVLSMLSSGMTQQDVLAVLAFVADREHKVYSMAVQ